MKTKIIIMGILTGIVLPIAFSYVMLNSQYPNLTNLDFFKKLWTGSEIGGPIIRLSVLINVPLFFIALKFNKENYARGVLVGTMAIGFYIFVLHLI